MKKNYSKVGIEITPRKRKWKEKHEDQLKNNEILKNKNKNQ
jgi:hypothetical protein